jgi:hypothetical protein
VLCLAATPVEILVLENDILDLYLDPYRRLTMRHRELKRFFLSVLVTSFPAIGAGQYQTIVLFRDPFEEISLEVLGDEWYPQAFGLPSFFVFW